MKRISIASLLGFVAVFAMGLAAVVNATDFWVGLTYTLMIGTLFASILGVVIRGRQGGAWMGCFIFGWGYFGLSFVPDFGYGEFLVTSNQNLPQLVSEWIFDRSNPEPPRTGPNTPSSPAEVDWMSRGRNAIKIGHLLFVILFAQSGSLLGLYLTRQREPALARPAPEVPLH